MPVAGLDTRPSNHFLKVFRDFGGSVGMREGFGWLDVEEVVVDVAGSDSVPRAVVEIHRCPNVVHAVPSDLDEPAPLVKVGAARPTSIVVNAVSSDERAGLVG
jgi:hypothetical protein